MKDMEMKYRILVDAAEFREQLEKDFRSARNEILIQTLSFEGDSVGKGITDLLLSLNAAPDIRILIDNFTRFILNDKFLYTWKNYFDADLTEEKHATREIISKLTENGVRVKFTSPVGLFFRRFAARNHKKIIAIDDKIAYIGGINFSEHNFSWHDMMLRIEDKQLIKFLKDDFELTWHDQNYFRKLTLEGIEMHSLDGRTNERAFERLFQIIDGAQEEIWVHSPYLSFPFLEKLLSAKRRGVKLGIITPEHNNRKFLKKYISWEAIKNNIQMWYYQPGMSHMKAMLVDKRYLIVGSTNFDYISYRVHPELMAIITDENLIREFQRRILEEDLKNSRNGYRQVSNLAGYYEKYKLYWLGRFFTRLSKF